MCRPRVQLELAAGGDRVSPCAAETSPVQRSRERRASREESEKQEESVLESLKI